MPLTAEQIEAALTLGDRLYHTKLFRPLVPLGTDTSGVASILEQVSRGAGEAELTAWIEAGEEYQRKHPAIPDLTPVGISGREFTFPWRGVTAFALVSQVAHGREAEARAYLQWAKDSGFTLVRTLAMCSWLDLSPTLGLQALPDTLDLIRSYGLYAEVVALSDTRTWPQLELWRQITEVGEILSDYPTAVLEVVNEGWHPTNRADELRPDFMPGLIAEMPINIVLAHGSSQDDESAEYAGGDYVTAHLDRTRDPWNQIRRVKELMVVSQTTGKPVVNDEPIGFGEVEEPGRRWTDPAYAFAFGVMSRVCSVPTTFHLEAGLKCGVPGPVQQRCALAFVDGCHILPDDVRLEFRNSGWELSPVKRFDTTAAVRVYSGIGKRSIAVVLGRTGNPQIEWAHGYHDLGVLGAAPGITVLEIGQ